MDVQEYLVSFGSAGEFTRFRPVQPVACRRGDRVVVRGPQGLELGVVMCPVTPAHIRHLSQTQPGELLRLANAEDEHTAEQVRRRSQDFYEDCSRLIAEM